MDNIGLKQIEVGASATAKASFTDASNASVNPSRVNWSSDNPLFSVTPDEKDPTIAHIVASGAGRGIITAIGAGNNGGVAMAQAVLVAMDKGALVQGKLDISVQTTSVAGADEPAQVSSEPNKQSQLRPSF